jgi:hypothetical protein
MFYAKGNKLNIELLNITEDMLRLIYQTIESLNSLYAIEITGKKGVEYFKDEISQWTRSFVNAVK